MGGVYNPPSDLFFGNISQFFRASFAFRRENQKFGKSKVGTVRARGAVMRLILICVLRAPPHVQLGVFSKLGKNKS
tara:strand:- start:645 stop:872 length:228 start_codon:yes stop_codon:yes gene_type:complete